MPVVIPGICRLGCNIVPLSDLSDGIVTEMKYFHRMNAGVIVIGIFIFCWGLVWLGNDMGWWDFSFPFWPVIVILTGIMILLYELKKTVSEE
jgi:CHASE2 domain-containing sensor protein